ncbi:FecR domain-containing protein [Brucepastera parasyntrophica]|uniref:FecR family protein n=1 Tax=Brucepastera parasyntrophica TaxID=2880008 RepID=UPI00210A08B9|nr:FecR domain-containing protein [Brucepastera parasyntrophica]ULQ59579.1 FecR domain-containing protein [Brucepastera parasyntrophica]
MKKILFCLFIIVSFTVFVLPLAAVDGRVITTMGKVEIQGPNNTWSPLKEGDLVNPGSIISTGFKSEATIQLGASILTIKPLTRMTLTQLAESENAVDTELYLEIGNVKAEVNSFNDKRNNFRVRSPIATASVRGTVFEMGDSLVIQDGSVLYVSSVGQSRVGKSGQQLELFGETISSPVTTIQTDMGVISLTTLPSSEITSPITAATPSAVIPSSSSGTSVVPQEKLKTKIELTIE